MIFRGESRRSKKQCTLILVGSIYAMKHPDNFGRAEKDSGLIVGTAQQRSIRSQDHTWIKIETVVMCFDLVVIIVQRVVMPCHIKREYAVQIFQVGELMIICKGCLGSNAYNLADLQRIGRIQACKKIKQEFVVRLQKETDLTGITVCFRKDHLVDIIVYMLLRSQ